MVSCFGSFCHFNFRFSSVSLQGDTNLIPFHQSIHIHLHPLAYPLIPVGSFPGLNPQLFRSQYPSYNSWAWRPENEARQALHSTYHNITWLTSLIRMLNASLPCRTYIMYCRLHTYIWVSGLSRGPPHQLRCACMVEMYRLESSSEIPSLPAPSQNTNNYMHDCVLHTLLLTTTLLLTQSFPPVGIDCWTGS